MKYIIIEDERGIEVAVLFDEFLAHSDVASEFKVLAAGFAALDLEGRFSAWGKSTSLNVKSRPEDEAIINTSLKRRL